MFVQPKPAYFRAPPETVLVVPSDTKELVLECEVISPPSAIGRTVYLKVSSEQLPAVLKAARDAAILERSQPMSKER